MKHKFLLILTTLIMLASTATAQSHRSVTTEYPFEITTDATNPILYYIYSGRDGGNSYVFANEIPYKETANKLQIVFKNPYSADLNQLWYFMQEGDGIKIISAADNRMVTVANTNDAPKCTLMQNADELTNAYYTWLLDCTNGYYAFQTSDGKTFLSHNGNWQTAGPQMGLYNANGYDDEGSRVTFEALPDDEDSGIVSITFDETSSPIIYTITGRRISKINSPGIYIINGKKTVIR